MSNQTPGVSRENWSSRFGIIMAVAGSAVGLGNFLRFPVQATANGGGAFLIPYFVALILLGVPLVWIEWTMGRTGGRFSHGSAPGILNVFWNHRAARFIGALGIFIPGVIFFYYLYIEAWTLAYSFFALTGGYGNSVDQDSMKNFLAGFQGLAKNGHFDSLVPAYTFFLIVFLLNFFIIYRGLAKGIEAICKVFLPLLILLGFLLAVRVMTLGTPDPSHPDWNIGNGFGYMWNPNFGDLMDAKVWLAAAGQIFFTLSVGMGMILCYASYMKENDDVVLSGLTAVVTNEAVEVIIGGSIAIPAAVVFFGPAGSEEIAHGGAFNLGFVTMPLIFNHLSLGWFVGFIWFFLLFLAGVTSSISMLQPPISFLEDEFGLNRKQSVGILGVISFIACQPVIFFLGNGVLDQMDFWAGTFLLVVFATAEVLIFGWVFGIDRAFESAQVGADIRIPLIFKPIIKYVTPLYLIVITLYWTYQSGLDYLLARNASDADKPYVVGTMIGLALFLAAIVVLVEVAWRRRGGKL